MRSLVDELVDVMDVGFEGCCIDVGGVFVMLNWLNWFWAGLDGFCGVCINWVWFGKFSVSCFCVLIIGILLVNCIGSVLVELFVLEVVNCWLGMNVMLDIGNMLVIVLFENFWGCDIVLWCCCVWEYILDGKYDWVVGVDWGGVFLLIVLLVMCCCVNWWNIGVCGGDDKLFLLGMEFLKKLFCLKFDLLMFGCCLEFC